jgi:undecaprenyl-diphosphatase
MKKRLPLLMVVVSTLMLALLVIFIDSACITFFDAWFYNEIASKISNNLTSIMIYISNFGSSIGIITLCICLFAFTKTRQKWALPVAVTVIISLLTNLTLKLLFARERPDILQLVTESNYSFPSGHAMINMSFYAMILLLTWRYVGNKTLKYGISFICIVIPLLIGFSRVYLGVHYATDVLAGWLLGFAITGIVYGLVIKKEEV